MARPTKQGIDYFPLDVNFDDKIELLLIEKGANGLSVLIILWQMIYSNEGYYIKDSKDLHLLIKRKISLDLNEISGIINLALERGIFNENLHESKNILTSRAIQKRYFDASKKKKVVYINPDFLLVDVSAYGNLVNSPDNSVNVGRNATNVNVKVNVKEDVKELKESPSKTPEDPPKKSNQFFEFPTLDDVIECGIFEKISPETCEDFFNHYEAQGWIIGNGTQMRNWRPKLVQWNKSNKIKKLENEAKNAINKSSVKSRVGFKFDPSRYEKRLSEIKSNS